tara:strand:- start:95 stop:1174 length:1080 start_codon:yes stop_codon:yes gene_type:complete
MSNSKISALTSAATVVGTEVLPIVQSSATVKVSVANLTPGLGTITAAKGGTGQTSYAVGDLLYADTTTTLAKLADVATGNALISGGVSTAPSYGKIGLTTHVSGTLPVANGGTNLTSFTAKGVMYASSTSALNTGSALVFDGSNLGVGTVTPSFPSGTGVAIYNSTVPRLKFTNSTTGDASTDGTQLLVSGSDFYIQQREAASVIIATNGADRVTISSAGIVTMSAYGAGAATFSAAGVISSVSDETWKIKDGAPVDPDAMLKQLEPGYWYYNDEKKEIFGKDRQLGFYAQNVNAAIGPEAAPEPESYISQDEDGNEITLKKPWGYYDRSVLAVTVMSLQKALINIELLTARIAALEAK